MSQEHKMSLLIEQMYVRYWQPGEFQFLWQSSTPASIQNTKLKKLSDSNLIRPVSKVSVTKESLEHWTDSILSNYNGQNSLSIAPFGWNYSSVWNLDALEQSRTKKGSLYTLGVNRDTTLWKIYHRKLITNYHKIL